MSHKLRLSSNLTAIVDTSNEIEGKNYIESAKDKNVIQVIKKKVVQDKEYDPEAVCFYSGTIATDDYPGTWASIVDAECFDRDADNFVHEGADLITDTIAMARIAVISAKGASTHLEVTTGIPNNGYSVTPNDVKLRSIYVGDSIMVPFQFGAIDKLIWVKDPAWARDTNELTVEITIAAESYFKASNGQPANGSRTMRHNHAWGTFSSPYSSFEATKNREHQYFPEGVFEGKISGLGISTGWSWSFWIKKTVAGDFIHDGNIGGLKSYHIGSPSTSQGMYTSYGYQGNDQFFISWYPPQPYKDEGHKISFVTHDPFLGDEIWHNVVIICERNLAGADGTRCVTPRIYLDSVDVTAGITDNSTGTWDNTMSFFPEALNAGGYPPREDRPMDWFCQAWSFPGGAPCALLAGMAFWNKGLTVPDVTEIWNNRVPKDLRGHTSAANLTGYYGFEEGRHGVQTGSIIPNMSRHETRAPNLTVSSASGYPGGSYEMTKFSCLDFQGEHDKSIYGQTEAPNLGFMIPMEGALDDPPVGPNVILPGTTGGVHGCCVSFRIKIGDWDNGLDIYDLITTPPSVVSIPLTMRLSELVPGERKIWFQIRSQACYAFLTPSNDPWASITVFSPILEEETWYTITLDMKRPAGGVRTEMDPRIYINGTDQTDDALTYKAGEPFDEEWGIMGRANSAWSSYDENIVETNYHRFINGLSPGSPDPKLRLDECSFWNSSLSDDEHHELFLKQSRDESADWANGLHTHSKFENCTSWWRFNECEIQTDPVKLLDGDHPICYNEITTGAHSGHFQMPSAASVQPQYISDIPLPLKLSMNYSGPQGTHRRIVVEDHVYNNTSSGSFFDGDMAVSLWVKPIGSQVSTILIDKRDGAFSQDTSIGGYTMAFSSSNRFWFSRALSSNVALSVSSVNTINPGVWNHLVAVYSASTKEVILYHDGLPSGHSHDETGSGTVVAETFDLFIGNSQPASNSIKGFLSDVAIFDETKNGSDILGLYNGGTPTPLNRFSALYAGGIKAWYTFDNGKVHDFSNWNPDDGTVTDLYSSIEYPT